MAEVELLPYKDYLICPTPVCVQAMPKSPECLWRDSGFIYSAEKTMVKNLPGSCQFDSRGEARESVIAEARKMIDAGL